MSKRPYEDIEYEKPCGRCDHKTPYEVEPPRYCENCGYEWGGRDYHDVPDELRLKIHG